MALGTNTVVTAENSTALGGLNTITTANTFAFGSNITTSIGKDVILGTDSASYLAGAQTSGRDTYTSYEIDGTTYNFAGVTPNNVISVGAIGKEGRIQNVAAGLISETSTDAINGSQLFAVTQSLEELAAKPDLDTNTDKSVRISSTSPLLTVSNATGAADGITTMTDYSISLSDQVATKTFVTEEIAKIDIPVDTDKSVRVNGSDLVTVTNTTGTADGITTMTDYTVSINKGVFTPVSGTGALTTPTTNGIATVADVVTAVNSGYWTANVGGAKIADVKFGDTLNFVDGNGTKAVIKNGGVAYDINVKSADGSIVTKPNTDGSLSISVNTSVLPKTVVDAGKGIEVTPVTNGNTTTYTVAVDDTIADKQYVADEIAKIPVVTDTNTDKSVRVNGSDLVTVTGTAGTADGITTMTDYTVTLSDKVATKDFVADEIAKIPTITDTNTISEVTQGDGITINAATEGDKTTYTVALDDSTKAQLAKEESVVAKAGETNIVVTQPRTNGTGGNEYEVSLAKDLTGIDSIGKDGSKFTFNGDSISAGNVNITDVKSPVNATDAANKQYVDDAIAAIPAVVDTNTDKSVRVASDSELLTVAGKAGTADGITTMTDYTISLSDKVATKDFVADEIAKIKIPEVDLSGLITYEESVVAGDNITVSQDSKNATGGKEFKVSLNSTLTGIDKIGGGTGAGSSISFGDNTINAGGATISNIANPTNATDAATKAYVDDKATTVAKGDGISVTTKTTTAPSGAVNTEYTVSLDDATKAQLAKEESVSAGSNIVVKQDKVNSTGGNNYNVSLAADLTGITSISNGDTTVKLGDGAVNVGGATITNVATPVNATDAVNKAYVDNSKTTVSKGDGITVTATQTTKDGATSVDYAVALDDGTKAKLAQVAVNAGNINKGINTRTEDGQVVNHKLGDTIRVVGDNKNITTATKDGAISVKMADDIKVNSVVIEGSTVGMNANGIDAGGNKVHNVAAGTISPSSSDAVNGGQLYATNMQVTKNAQDIQNLGDQLGDMRDEYRAGIADAAAVAGLPEIHLAGKSMFAIAGSTFKGESAMAVGYSRLSDNSRVKFKATGSVNTQGDVLGTVGMGWAW